MWSFLEFIYSEVHLFNASLYFVKFCFLFWRMAKDLTACFKNAGLCMYNAVICQKKKVCISLPAWNAAATSLFLMCDSNYVLTSELSFLL